MQIKIKYSWVKHLDFMVIDLITLFLCFLLSYWMKFGDLAFHNNEDWVRYLFLVLVLNVVITLFVNPYSGILRRPFYMEIIRAFQLAVYNLLLAALVFYWHQAKRPFLAKVVCGYIFIIRRKIPKVKLGYIMLILIICHRY